MSNDEQEGLLERSERGAGTTAESGYTTGQPAAQGSAAVPPTGTQPVEAVEPRLVGTDVDVDDDTITVTTQYAVPQQAETVAAPVQPVQEQPVVTETEQSADVEAFRAESAGTETTHVETVRAEPVQPEVVETRVVETAPVQPAPQPQAAATDEDTVRVERYEEELQARKVERQAGEVRVSKDVVEEQRTLEVPVEREEVRVRSVTPSETTADASEAFQEGTISVPVREQDVELRKEVRVAEEIDIEKREVTERERVSGTVREERVNVEEVGDVEVDRHSDSPLSEDVRPRD